MRKMRIRARRSATLVISLFTIGVCLVYGDSRSRALNPGAVRKVDLRERIASFKLPVKSQGGRNTCSVFATTFLLEYETAKANNQSGVDFSEDYLDAVTDMVKGAQDDGDYFNNILSGYLKFGTVDESDFPNSAIYNPHKLPSDSLISDGKNNIKFVPVFIRENPGGSNPWGLTDDHIQQIIAQLDAGRPVAAGWRLARGGAIENVKVLGVDAWTKNVMKTARDYVGHSMPIVGYAKGAAGEGEFFIIRNSAGVNWGDNGYWYCTFDYAKQNIADVFYLTAKPRTFQLPSLQLIRMPVPRYIRVDELQRVPTIPGPTTKGIILQKKG
jgi:papain like protease